MRRGPCERPDELQPDGARRRRIRRLARRLDGGGRDLARPAHSASSMHRLPGNGLGSLHRWWSRSESDGRHGQYRGPAAERPIQAAAPSPTPVAAGLEPNLRRPARFRTHLIRLGLATGLPLVALAIGLAWWVAANARSTALRDLSRTPRRWRPTSIASCASPASPSTCSPTAPSLDAALAGEPAASAPRPSGRAAGADRSPPGGAAQHRAVRHPGTAAGEHPGTGGRAAAASPNGGFPIRGRSRPGGEPYFNRILGARAATSRRCSSGRWPGGR